MTYPVCAAERFDSVWFGVPGQMDRLPIPNAGMADPLNRGGVDHELPNGVTTTRRTSTKRDYALSWDQLTPDQADVLVAYYAGVKPPGPYRLIDPRWRNQFGLDSSTFGAGPKHEQNWNVSGTPLTVAAVAPPSGVRNSRVLAWAGAATGHLLWQGDTTTSGRPSARLSVPYVPSVGWVWSIYARTSDGTPVNVSVNFDARPLTGTGGLSLSSAVTVGTTWSRLVFIAPAQSSAFDATTGPYIVPSLSIASTGVTGRGLYVCAPQLQAQAAASAPYVVGLGAGAFTVGADPMSSSSTVWWRRSHTLALRGV